MDFGQLKDWLDSLPDQTDGIAGSVCQTGELYEEFSERALARPGDEKVIERAVSETMMRRLQKYFEGREGMIYWRVRFESEVAPSEQVTRYDAEGPDEDICTGQRCVLDKNWKSVGCYVRLYCAKHKILRAA